MEVGFPLTVDSRGRLGDPDEDEHVRQLIEQVLFTSPGQRVNRPDFGAGLLELVFGPLSAEVVAAAELAVHGSLDRWLGAVIDVEGVTVEPRDSTLFITVAYRVRRDQRRRVAVFDTARYPWLR